MVEQKEIKDKDPYMFKRSCEERWHVRFDSEKLIALLKSQCRINDDVVLMFKHNNIIVEMVDLAHVMIAVTIMEDGYKTDVIDGFRMVITKKVMKVLFQAKTREFLFEFWLDNNRERVKISWNEEGESVSYKTFATTPAEYSKPKIPLIEMDAEIYLVAKTTKRLTIMASHTSDYIRFEKYEEGNKYVLRAGVDGDDMIINHGTDPVKFSDITAKHNMVYANYNIDYFKDILNSIIDVERVLREVQPVQFEWKTSYPCRVTVVMRGFSMSYMMAPRIESS